MADKPRPVIKIEQEPVESRKAKPLPTVKNPGELGAEIFDAVVKKLQEGGHNMVLTKAKFKVETKALVVDKHLFGDEEAHESLLIFEGELERLP